MAQVNQVCRCGHIIKVSVNEDEESGKCGHCERRWGFGDQDKDNKTWANELKRFRSGEHAFILEQASKDKPNTEVDFIECLNTVLRGEDLINPVRQYTGKDFLLDYYSDMTGEVRQALEHTVMARVDTSDFCNVKLVPICAYCKTDLDPNAWECPGCGSI